MRAFRFQLSINVDGILREAGCEVPESDIPSGCLASLVRLGQVVEVEPPKVAPVAAELPPPKLAEAKPPELKTAAPKSPAKK